MNILDYEEYRSLWKLTEEKPFLTGFPLHLDVELTDACNLKCSFCFQNFMEYKRSIMPFELFAKIIDEGVEEGLAAIKLQSRGESFLHPKIADCIKYAKDKGVLDVQVTTNAILLDDEKIDLIVKNGLDMLIISYDLEHAEATLKTKDPMTHEEYTSFIQSVVTKAHEARLKYDSKIKIRIQESNLDHTEEGIIAIEKRNKALFPEADIFLTNPIYDSNEDNPHFENMNKFIQHPCTYLWQRLVIFACGTVTTCCRDYNGKFNRVGNARYDTVKNLWHSSQMRDFRIRHLQGRRSELHLCSLCDNYIADGKTGKPAVGCNNKLYDFRNPVKKTVSKLARFKKRREKNK
jgi:MoaA/NifB/PqqE/SkfB family radical SAM enzyme